MANIFYKKDHLLYAMPANMFANPLRLSTTSRLLVLCAVILVPKFLPTEFASPFLVFLALLLMPFSKIQRSYLKLVWPLLGVFVIGIIGVYDHDSRHVLRDIAYALTPISLIFIGYWIAGNRGIWPLVLKVMVTFGFVWALVHLKTFMLNPMLLKADLIEVRETAGGSGSLVALAFLLGLFQHRFGLNDLYPRLLPRFIVMPVLLASFVLSYSRTTLMVAIIFSLALLGWVTRVNSRFVLAIVLLISGYTAIAMVTPEGEVGTFRSKIVRSVTEVTISDYGNMRDIAHYWRSFEAYIAVKQFSSGNFLQQILGQGFGALVDLGFYIPLGGDVEFRYIPITHNGYVYILLKVGILGLVLYAFFYIYIIRYAIRYSRSIYIEQIFLTRLLLGCVLSLITTMYVVGGMAEMHETELVLLLGYLVRQLTQYQAGVSRIVTGRIA